MNSDFDWNEIDFLITTLRTKGITYLIGDGSNAHEDDGHIVSVHLIQRLAASGYPLVENASISLFILHPELAPSVVEALLMTDFSLTSHNSSFHSTIKLFANFYSSSEQSLISHLLPPARPAPP